MVACLFGDGPADHHPWTFRPHKPPPTPHRQDSLGHEIVAPPVPAFRGGVFLISGQTGGSATCLNLDALSVPETLETTIRSLSARSVDLARPLFSGRNPKVPYIRDPGAPRDPGDPGPPDPATLLMGGTSPPHYKGRRRDPGCPGSLGAPGSQIYATLGLRPLKKWTR